MPRIEFGDRDLLRGTVLEPAWYRVRVDSIGEALSKDRNSTNYPVEATVLFNADNGDTKFAGVPLDWNFNSKAIGFAGGYLRALGHDPKKGERFELSDTVGSEIDVYVENAEWQGRIINRVNHKYRTPRNE